MKTVIVSITLLTTLSFASCSNRTNHSPLPSVSEEAREGLERPINCATARQDIRLLESERASVAKRLASGVRSVFPIAAVAGMLTGDYSDRVEVASGQYNDAIDNKILQIRKRCRL